MEKRKIEALRDLAIAHYPKASKQRADAMKYQGGMWADSGLTSALLFEDYAATAVEKQAHELLQLTFMHPNAQPVDPVVWDAVEDARIIAEKAHMLERAVEMQPQIEAAILDAARLLCELAGVALPGWVDAAATAKVKAEADTSQSGDEIPGKIPKTANCKLAIKAAWEIEKEAGKRATANQVIERLQTWVDHKDNPKAVTELTHKIPNGVKWVTCAGKENNYDIEACRKTLENWNKSRN